MKLYRDTLELANTSIEGGVSLFIHQKKIFDHGLVLCLDSVTVFGSDIHITKK